MQNGGWDGDCATWQNYYGRTLAQINATPLGVEAMGTGPFALEKWDVGKELVLKANEDYWMKEPAWEGAPSGPPVIKRVVIRLIEDYETRFTQLQAKQADSIEIESSTRWQDLDGLVGRICSFNDEDCRAGEDPDAPLELVRGSPSARRDDIFFNWEMNTEGGNDSAGSGRLNGEGVPPDFFSNVHVRRAFAYCFNYNAYLSDYLAGEGVRTINVMPPGMVGYNPDTPYYVHDPQRCENEFRQAEFEGRSVWEVGFKLGIPFDSADPQLEIIATIFQDELVKLNKRFLVEARPLSGSDYYSQRNAHRLPLFLGGWSEDIHDPHNWVYPYAIGTYARNQGMPADLSRQFGDYISRGVAAADVEQRATIYHGFNELYYEQAPAILLFSTVNRHYQQRWVNGWYDNPINPGIYFYALRKD
jgi:peptide/nickel transport system substrate-binding protein